jgi:hypothetical protein
LATFSDHERLRALRQKAEGFKTFSYPGVGFMTQGALKMVLMLENDC